jgi:glycosyltransferase involved in cell wall biosynthesis
MFAAFDLVVLSSRTEGTPIVLLEALAAGVRVVATAVGGVPDAAAAAAAGRDVTLVPPDDVDGLAEAIAAALSRPADARGPCGGAHSAATEGWLDAYERVYAAVQAGASGDGTHHLHQAGMRSEA